jgi:hypothetical protein
MITGRTTTPATSHGSTGTRRLSWQEDYDEAQLGSTPRSVMERGFQFLDSGTITGTDQGPRLTATGLGSSFL